jgi:hypothetical protein
MTYIYRVTYRGIWRVGWGEWVLSAGALPLGHVPLCLFDERICVLVGICRRIVWKGGESERMV